MVIHNMVETEFVVVSVSFQPAVKKPSDRLIAMA
jgi:hypothetical protein